MAVTVKQPNNLEINSPADCIAYLSTLYSATSFPFTQHTKVKITSRVGVPADVCSYDVGLFSFGRGLLPIVSLLVLMDDGNFTLMSVPKVNVVRWT